MRYYFVRVLKMVGHNLSMGFHAGSVRLTYNLLYAFKHTKDYSRQSLVSWITTCYLIWSYMLKAFV